MLDINLSWKDHIKTAENKLAESFGLLHCTKQFLDETALFFILIWIRQILHGQVFIALNWQLLAINRNKQLALYLIKTGLGTLGQLLSNKSFSAFKLHA